MNVAGEVVVAVVVATARCTRVATITELEPEYAFVMFPKLK
jgi:hypothetical protein